MLNTIDSIRFEATSYEGASMLQTATGRLTINKIRALPFDIQNRLVAFFRILELFRNTLLLNRGYALPLVIGDLQLKVRRFDYRYICPTYKGNLRSVGSTSTSNLSNRAPSSSSYPFGSSNRLDYYTILEQSSNRSSSRRYSTFPLGN